MRVVRIYAILLVTAILSGNAFADGHGYWANSGGKVWKSGSGKCWGSSSKKPEMLGEDCGAITPAAPVEPAPIPPSDEDNDGVPDSADKCPGSKPVPVDSNGCESDSDGDGVPDYLDVCPNTPAGATVDANGCSNALVSLQGVHFKFDSASLTSEAKSILDGALSAIQSNASKNLQVEGHTDSTGPASYNQGLSQRRAQSVVDYLVSKGVSSSRLSAQGFGESSPVSSNDTSADRAKNRRVEIYAR
ncbi:MAG: OmpA family protein [Gammaproteobacteria bacterium]|jgi:OOP family OmpA-OmpF porin